MSNNGYTDDEVRPLIKRAVEVAGGGLTDKAQDLLDELAEALGLYNDEGN